MKLFELSWPRIDSLSRDLPVVIPIAAVEQHGHHMPLGTDSILLGEIVSRADETLCEDVLITPLQWLGNSHHHMDFPGTLSADPRCYLDLLNSLLQNVIDHGFRRILLLNGHGGNDVPGKQATFEIRQRHRDRKDLLLLFSTYWNLAGAPSAEIELKQTAMAHACEWETSMMMAINSELVQNHDAAIPVEPGNPFRPASRAWTTKDRSSVGHVGWPNEATLEKGALLLEHFSYGVVEMVRRMGAWNGESWDG